MKGSWKGVEKLEMSQAFGGQCTFGFYNIEDYRKGHIWERENTLAQS